MNSTTLSETDPQFSQEYGRRRTFAIISHPDAGKTTLTEKLLLFGGSIEIAGAVRGRKTQRAATSDWMELEKQRGISVSSTVLTFDYAGCRVNLLDTPGHHDFSEDTYRTLMAADAAVMVLDMAKGIESQTEKLFRVCALRKIPILTFVNKVDRPGRSPLEIIAEIEEKFSLEAVPHNWPIGSGQDFCGIVDLLSEKIHRYGERNNQRRVQASIVDWDALTDLPEELVASVREEVDLVRMAGTELTSDRFLRGEQTPVYFGSGLTNFGVESFLKGFLDLCPPPSRRLSDQGMVEAKDPQFTGFVFKIQANLDPRHRDRVAYIRVCSGKFERDMECTVTRTNRKLRLARALQIFGQERKTVEQAYPGDIVGLICPGEFRLGDTLCEERLVQYEPLPQFSPEFFAVLECPDTSRRKQFDRGLAQLVEEGAVQVFHDASAARREHILASVGELQFDVVRFRLETEYNTPTNLRWRPYKLARWFNVSEEQKKAMKVPYSTKFVKDQFGHDALLLQSEWDARVLERDNPDIEFHAIRVSQFHLEETITGRL